MFPLLASSQTLLNDSTCCVPCEALKKALIVKNERDFLKNQIGVTRDSVNILTNIVISQDSVIKTQDSSILLYKKNEENYNFIVDKKDRIIELKDKQIKQQKTRTNIAWMTTGLNTVIFILILLL
jgi:hypothetical protein